MNKNIVQILDNLHGYFIGTCTVKKKYFNTCALDSLLLTRT